MRRLIPVPLTALALGGLLAPHAAQAQDLRYTTTAPGGVTATGNTLGLSKASGVNGPGTLGAIGTFITTDTTSVDDDPLNSGNPWPAGTTNDWGLNGSSGYLLLPDRVEVLYAELVWAGSYDYGDEDVSTYLDDSIALKFGSDTISVSPDASTKQTLSGQAAGTSPFDIRYYLRSADVTEFVQDHGEGSYTVMGVPATQSMTDNSLNAAGWTLVVAYRSDDEPIRNLSVFVGGSFVDEDSTQDYTASGFCAPPLGPVEGEVVVSALEGDAALTGDSLSIAPTASDTFVNLSGPNNPETNVFASQINDDEGDLDTSGTFGTVNHDAAAGTNTSGARQGWDLTTLALSATAGTLANDQTSAVLRTTTTGDSFFPTLLAFEIDVKAPNFTDSQTTVSPTTIGPEGQITVTTTLKNSGEAPAADLTFVMDVDSGLDLVSFEMDGSTGDIDGTPVTETTLGQGVDAGTLDVGVTRTVEMVFDVVGEPEAGGGYAFSPTWRHKFVTCEGESAIAESHSPATATVTFDEPDTGDTGEDTGTDTAVDDTDDGEGDGELGPKCGCAVSPAVAPWWSLLPGLALSAAVLRRRR